VTVGQTGKAVEETKGYKKMVAHSVTFQGADDQHEGKIPGGLLLYSPQKYNKTALQVGWRKCGKSTQQKTQKRKSTQQTLSIRSTY